MEYKDYYQILGVDRKADPKDIKKAFRRLAREYHPDVRPGDKQAEDRFKEINEAYEVLSDPQKRAKYDQLGASYRDWQRMGGQPGGFDWTQWAAGGMAGAPGGVRVEYRDIGDLFGDQGFEGSGIFSDFFNTIFGGMGARPAEGRRTARQARSVRGRDMEQPVSITLEEAYAGTTRTFQIDGRRLEVKIPKGAKTGTRVRVSGQGERGQGGGATGDLYLRIQVEPHKTFVREGDDLHMTLPVDLYTAVLGGQVTVNTLGGEVSLRIPPGTSSGQRIRLQGRGMPRLNKPGEHGDLFVRIEIKVPRKLSARQRELFEELARSNGQA